MRDVICFLAGLVFGFFWSDIYRVIRKGYKNESYGRAQNLRLY